MSKSASGVPIIPLSNRFDKPGIVMPDGTTYAGISPDTGRPMFTTPEDAPVTMNFNDAAQYAANLGVFCCKDWCVPTDAELKVLFENRAAIGGFNTSGSSPAGWYWSSSPLLNNFAWARSFDDGLQHFNSRYWHRAVRCVRG